jgi:hypothetical protein
MMKSSSSRHYTVVKTIGIFAPKFQPVTIPTATGNSAGIPSTVGDFRIHRHIGTIGQRPWSA